MPGASPGGPPSNNVFATSLPPGLDEAGVNNILGQYGSIVSTKIVSSPDNFWTAALVRFGSVEEAGTVVNGLNGNIPNGLDKPIQVQFAMSGGGKGRPAPEAPITFPGSFPAPPAFSGPNMNDNLYVGNLPENASVDDIKATFAPAGIVVQAKVLATWNGAASALVRMCSPQAAEQAISMFNGGTIDNQAKQIIVRYAENRKGKGECFPGGPDFGGCSFGKGPSIIPAPLGGGCGLPGGCFDPSILNLAPMPFDGGCGGCFPPGPGKGGPLDPNSMEAVCRSIEDSGALPGGSGKGGGMYIEVQLTGLPPDCLDVHLYVLMAPFGQIAARGVSTMILPENGTCRGSVNFLSQQSAEMAIRTLNGTILAGNRTLKVEIKGQKGGFGGAPPIIVPTGGGMKGQRM